MLPPERRTARSTSATRVGLDVAMPSATVGATSVGTRCSTPARNAAAYGAQRAACTPKSRGTAAISPVRASSAKPRSAPSTLLP